MSLERVFKFEVTDLAANRRGELTARQEQQLHDFRESMLRNHWQSGLFITVLLAAGTGIAFLAGNRELATLGLWVTPMLAAVFALSWLTTRFSTRHLLIGAIRVAEGAVELTTGRTRTATLYGVKLGQKQFFVSKAQYEAFQQGQTYRLYYVDGVPYFILSVELL